MQHHKRIKYYQDRDHFVHYVIKINNCAVLISIPFITLHVYIINIVICLFVLISVLTDVV